MFEDNNRASSRVLQLSNSVVTVGLAGTLLRCAKVAFRPNY